MTTFLNYLPNGADDVGCDKDRSKTAINSISKDMMDFFQTPNMSQHSVIVKCS